MPRIGGIGVWISALGLGLLGGLGCNSSNEEAAKNSGPTFTGVKLVVGAVGDRAILSGLASQRGEWSATRKAEVTIQETPVDPKTVKGVDLLVFPADRLGELVDYQALVVVPETLVRPPVTESAEDQETAKSEEPAPDPLQFADIVTTFRERVSRYGSERLALPYGGSALVLVYDRTAFDRDENRKAAEELKLPLHPPTTWSQLDALAKFFQGRDWNGDGKPDHGIALALGSDTEGVGDATYLARAASLGQHRDQYSFLFDSDTMAPRIDSPPFVEALRDLKALKDLGPPEMATFDAEAARKAFAQGKTALLIDRAEKLTQWGDHKAVGVLPLPGSERVYDPARKIWETPSTPNHPSYLPSGGGWLVGVSTTASPQVRDAALDFARYLISPETAKLIRADRNFPMLPVRSTLISEGLPGASTASGVDSKQWADAVSRTIMAEKVIAGLRIPESQGYFADLAKGRAAVLAGEDPQSALKAVAQAWTERTKRLGTARQLWHYRRSLNVLSTLPNPPDR